MAQAAGPDSAPVLLWGRATAHICLGQSQSLAHELAPRLDVPVVRRPLGGGAVWVDEHQCTYTLIMPLQHAPRRPAEWSAWALQPALAAYRRFGLVVELHGEDLWLQGRKIAGSGSATIGGCAVIASSFLLRFPRERFARCIAGSAEFRAWLLEGLAQTMTDWESHADVPHADVLRETYAAAAGHAFGWRVRSSALTPAESMAAETAHAELEDELEDEMENEGCGGGRRACAGGVKLNAESSLVERMHNGLPVRELVVRGAVARRAIIAAG